MERQNVLIPDGIDDGVGMQCFRRLSILIEFTSKQLSRRLILTASTCIDGKDRRTCESKHHVLLDAFGNQCMHISKLRSVAFVEYQHDILFGKNLTQLLVFVIEVRLHQVRQFLNGRDDDCCVIILYLLQQYLG